jgi:hypothetical protein
MLIYAILQTIELWIFLGILGVALLIEEGVKALQRRADRKQIMINLEIDRLHR